MKKDAGFLAAVCRALFLLLTPGFGIQYLMYLCPFLTLVNVRLGLLYGSSGGFYAAAIYINSMERLYPMTSYLRGGAPLTIATVGCVTWLVILTFVVRCINKGLLPLNRITITS